MFGRHLAYEYQGSGGEGWTPPWLRQQRERHRQHFSGRHHGHGPFGHGDFGPQVFGLRRFRGQFGPGGPFGPGGEGHRFFGRGDIKFALLELLQERSMYGYEMMKTLEEKSAG